MADIRLPDGRIIRNVPKDTTKSELMRRVQLLEAPDPAQDVGFIGRVGEQLGERGQQLGRIFKRELGPQTPHEELLQTAGQIAGGIGDIAGEALETGVRGAGRALSAITPEVIEGPVRDIASDIGERIVESPAGQLGLRALREGVETYQEFKEKFPRASRNLESIVNIGALAAPLIRGTTPVGRAGRALERTGVQQAVQQKRSFVQDLVRPKQTPKVRTEQALRTQERGVLQQAEVVPSVRETDIIDEVTELADIGGNKSLQGNLNVIQKAISKEASSLENALKNTKIFFPRKEFNARLRTVKESLGENPLLVGDAEKTAQRIVNKMNSIVQDNPATPAGLLKSRKQLDNWVRSQKGGKIFDPQNENALSISLREIRQATNNFIDEKVPNVAVKESLRKQSRFFDAIDNIAPKAADEADNAIGRLVERVLEEGPFKRQLRQGLGDVGGTLSVGAGVITKPARGAVRAILGPTLKRNLGRLLRATDKTIQQTSSAALLDQLQGDRDILASLVE